MLTIFTIPKPFRGHINVIQRNAIQSWLQLSPKCKIILFGDEDGAQDVAREFKILHIPEVKKNEFGTPLLNSVFNQVKNMANNHILVYINCDIILMSDFLPAVKAVNFPLFLLAGRRWDLDVKEGIQFEEKDWEIKLRKLIIKSGRLHPPSGIDYFVFPRNLSIDLPPFAVGRLGWDNWFLYRARSLGIPLIDATNAITVVHQVHNFSNFPNGRKSRDKGLESRRNLELVGGPSHAFSLRDADWVLTNQGLKGRRIFPPLQFCYHYLGSLHNFYPWLASLLKVVIFPARFLTNVARSLQQFLIKRRWRF